MTAMSHPVPDDRLAKKNVALLAAAQALYVCFAMAMITFGGIVGHLLADNKALATLPVSTFILGTLASTVPASLLMRRTGRRAGFMLGASCGMLSGIVAVTAIFARSFPLFCLATTFAGVYQATALYYRFAAADTASDMFKPRAISLVLFGGLAAAFIGPQIIIWTKEMFAPVLYAGTYAAVAGLAALNLVVLSFVDIPVPPPTAEAGTGRPLREILRQPRFLVAAGCGMVAYAVMNLVMTATPLAMVACNHVVEDAAFVVQWHVVAMYAPSFFTGTLINRFGKGPIIATGMFLLVMCGIVALSGIAVGNFLVALVFLGVGWNFGFVGATAMVTDCHTPLERNKVQALNDLMVFGLVACASFSSGLMLNLFGWGAVNFVLFPLVGICVALLVWLVMQERGGRRKMAAG